MQSNHAFRRIKSSYNEIDKIVRHEMSGKKCFFCLNLRTGVKVLALVTLILDCPPFCGFIYEFSSDQTVPETRPFYATMIASRAVSIIANVLLLVGVTKEKRSFILPWLVMKMINFVVLVMFTIVIFALAVFAVVVWIDWLSNMFVGLATLAFIFWLTLLAINLYFWFVVRGLYVSLEEPRRRAVV